MAYTTSTKIANTLKRSLTAEETAMVSIVISAVETIIDNYTGRVFEAGAAETRYYDGEHKRNLYLNDDLLSLTSIKTLDYDGTVLDDDLTENDDYVLYPLNETPKTWIYAPNGIFPCWHRAVQITGVFAYSQTPPDDLSHAATLLACHFLINPNELTKESIEGYSREIPGIISPAVKLVLDMYRRITL